MTIKFFPEQLRMTSGGDAPPDVPPPPEGYLLRPFRPGEEAAVAAVMRSAEFKDWNEQTVRERALSGPLGAAGVWVIERDGAVVATCTALVRREPEGLVYQPSWLAVDPAHRNRSLGISVALACRRTAFEAGARRYELKTDEWRLPGIRRYLDRGWEPVAASTLDRARWRVVRRLLDFPEFRARTLEANRKTKRLFRRAVAVERRGPFEISTAGRAKRRLAELILVQGCAPNRCPFCESKPVRPLYIVKGCAVAECAACGVAFVADPPAQENLDALYGETYYQGGGKRGYGDYLGAEKSLRKEARRHLERIEAFIGACDSSAPRRSLDVGCAAGFFVAEARLRGWDAHGLDVSPFAVEHGRTRLGLDSLRVGELREGDYAAQSFDLISFWDTIEHLRDPRGQLCLAASFLKPGGIVALATGDRGSSGARLRGRAWRLMTPPHHLFFFTTRALARELDALGFEVLSIETNDKFIEAWPFRTRFFRRLIRAMKKGDVVEIIARKRAGQSHPAAVSAPSSSQP